MTADTIRAGIEQYLSPLLKEYSDQLHSYAGPKIMRDVIWGLCRYEPYELALIDSPVFQRLRNIFQTSLALFTYPCSVHSRFEHSLGVATVANRMLDAVEERTKRRNSVLRLETRIAALLHDLGHGPFSHSSEKFYEQLTDKAGNLIFGEYGLLAKENPSLFSRASASEVLTYLMVTTRSFETLWDKIVEMYKDRKPELRQVDLERVGSMILGVDEKVGDDGRFYRAIVNGPFDADKLDYLPRDGYFTGLEIVVDIERLLVFIYRSRKPVK